MKKYENIIDRMLCKYVADMTLQQKALRAVEDDCIEVKLCNGYKFYFNSVRQMVDQLPERLIVETSYSAHDIESITYTDQFADVGTPSVSIENFILNCMIEEVGSMCDHIQDGIDMVDEWEEDKSFYRNQ